MSEWSWVITGGGNTGPTLTLISGNGEVCTAESSHPNYGTLEAAARESRLDELNVPALTDVGLQISADLFDADPRIGYANGCLTFNGDPIEVSVGKQVVKMMRQGDSNWVRLARFVAKLMSNPSPKARKHLWDWVKHSSLTITEDGDFIAYKGVQEDGTSHHAGPGIINGVPMHGHLPNTVGSVISIPRSYVDDDRDDTCSRGLHVGTHAHAQSFGWGSRLLTVSVSPEDVVVVPKHGPEKIRVCRYTVLGIAPAAALEDTSY